ncbi:MAG TPA: ice-binding family protein, partial [Promineifilum sp.]|nr:ice-binding family protein [Promineifilum sp.]
MNHKVFTNRVRKGAVLVLAGLIMTVALIMSVRVSHAVATAPSLGTAGSFAVLGGSTVTNTGPTVVTGDLGVAPGSAIVGFFPDTPGGPGTVVGTQHAADAVALQAQADAATAYTALAGEACDFTHPLIADIGGQTANGRIRVNDAN